MPRCGGGAVGRSLNRWILCLGLSVVEEVVSHGLRSPWAASDLFLEKYTMFMDWKNQCSENDYTAQSNL